MSSVYQVPYETGSQILDCENVKKGYNKPSYSLDPSCNGIVPSCDNRSYSAYATDSAYQGYYDNCFKSQPEAHQCDLKYVNAPPKVVEACWTRCCNSKMSDCNQDCHDACVVGGSVLPPRPSGPSGPVSPVPLK